MNLDSAFSEIYESTRRQTLAYITAKCASCDDIADLVQETYTELYALMKRRGVGYIREPEALVIGLAKQQLSRHYRRDTLRRKHITELNDEDGREVELSDIEALSVEEIVAERLDFERIRELVRSYGIETERIFRLYFAEELTLSEIARLTEQSESNVKNRLYRTLTRIRNEITKGENQ